MDELLITYQNMSEKLLNEFHLGNTSICISICKEMLLNPLDQEQHLLFILGGLYLNEKKYDFAISSFLKLMKLDPTYPNCKLQLVHCYLNTNNPKKVENYCLTEIQIDDNNLKLYSLLIEVYLKFFHSFSLKRLNQMVMQFQYKIKSFGSKELTSNFGILELLLSRFEKYRSVKLYKNRIDMLARLPKNSIIAEVGVQRGHYAEQILTKTKPKSLYLIDCWDFQDKNDYSDHHANLSQKYHDELYDSVCFRFNSEVAEGRVVIKRGYSIPILMTFPDHFFDWVYIDANHAYETVKDDLRVSLEKVRGGGYICGHDYVSDEIVSNYGVERAVDELIQRKQVKLIAWTQELYGSFILQVL